MTDAIHYEVQVLEQGRWYVHARYPREEREQALADARSTESITGHPTKVIRDLYHPEAGTNDEHTIYVGLGVRLDNRAQVDPGARRGSPRAVAERQARAAVGLSVRRKVRADQRRIEDRERDAKRSSPVLNVAASIAMSLLIATVFTGALSWALMGPHGVALEAATFGQLLLGTYFGAFFLSFMAFTRRDHVRAAKSGVRSPRKRVNPLAERISQFGQVASRSAIGAAVSRWRHIKQRKFTLGRSRDFARSMPRPVPGAAPEENRVLARAVLARFMNDTIKPCLGIMISEDALTHRGIVFYLAGAGAELRPLAHLETTTESEIIVEVLAEAGAAVDVATARAPSDAALVAAGRRAMSDYLTGEDDQAHRFADAFMAWRQDAGARLAG